MLAIEVRWPTKSTREAFPKENPPMREELKMLSAAVLSVWEAIPKMFYSLFWVIVALKELSFILIAPRLIFGLSWSLGRVCCIETVETLSQDKFLLRAGVSSEKSNSHFFATSLERVFRSF